MSSSSAPRLYDRIHQKFERPGRLKSAIVIGEPNERYLGSFDGDCYARFTLQSIEDGSYVDELSRLSDIGDVYISMGDLMLQSEEARRVFWLGNDPQNPSLDEWESARMAWKEFTLQLKQHHPESWISAVCPMSGNLMMLDLLEID